MGDDLPIGEQLTRAPNFQILETMLYTTHEAGCALMSSHIARLLNSVRDLGGPRFPRIPDAESVKSQIQSLCATLTGPHKIRLLFDGSSVELQALPIKPWTSSEKQDLKVVLDTRPVCSTDVFLRYKTTHRTAYNEARKRANLGSGEAFDVLLYNERGEITETSICNVAVEMDSGELVTPPVSCGLLAGVQRSVLLANGSIREGLVLVDDLRAASKAGRRIVCFNSVRRVFDVKLIEPPGNT